MRPTVLVLLITGAPKWTLASPPVPAGGCRACHDGWSRTERFAFWINAYNAYTLRLIVDHHPIDSIHPIGWLAGAAFRHRFIAMPALRGEPYSLDDICK